MKDNQKYDNGRQLHIEDYLQENKLETEGNVEVPSVFDVSPLKEIDTKTVTNELLEKILSSQNAGCTFQLSAPISFDIISFELSVAMLVVPFRNLISTVPLPDF